MPRFKVSFIHAEEFEYKGFIVADSHEEAMEKVKDDPFDIEYLQEWSQQGLYIRNIDLEEVED